MLIYDISLPISADMVVWPGNPAVELGRISSMDAGAPVNISRLAFDVHTGTHVDAPHHFLNDHRTVESLSMDILTGPAQVIRIPDEVNLVTDSVLEKASIPPGTRRLLLKTRNSHLWENGSKKFNQDFIGINAEAAEWIVVHGIKLVGIDYLSIAPYTDSVPPHQALLKPGVIILEGLDLGVVPPGLYDLYCLPLKLTGAEGAPARAILVGK